MEWWQAAILGLVEGVTEYLPVSSTGHLILAASLLGLDDPSRKSAVDAFTIVIQGGAILAVMGLYWPRVRSMLAGLAGRDAAGLRLLGLLAAGFVPAAVLGLLLDDLIEAWLFRPLPVLAALLGGAVYMMLVDQWRAGRFGLSRAAGAQRELESLTVADAGFIGLMQCVAMWPGTSRSMMTITAGMLVGLRPRAAAEFSFLLGLPTLGAATLYKLAQDQLAREPGQPGMFQTLGVASVVVGMTVAAVSAAAAVRWLVGFLGRHGLTPFAWYRVALCAVLGGMLLSGTLTIGPQSHTPPAAPAPAAELRP